MESTADKATITFRSIFAPLCLVNIAHYMLYEASREHNFRHKEKYLLNLTLKAAYNYEQAIFQHANQVGEYDLMKYQLILDDFRNHLTPTFSLLKLYIRQKLSNANHIDIEVLSTICTLDVVMQLVELYTLHTRKKLNPQLSIILKNGDRLIELMSKGDKTVVTLSDTTFDNHVKVIRNKIDNFNYEQFTLCKKNTTSKEKRSLFQMAQ